LVTADNGGNTASVLLGNGTTTTTSIGISQISGISVATRSAALAAQGQIDAYFDNVNTISGIIGASMSRFQMAMAALGASSENYDAARSRIVDADIAEESANLVKERILQQAGMAVLAQANQGPALSLELLLATRK
jgi:flagellin